MNSTFKNFSKFFFVLFFVFQSCDVTQNEIQIEEEKQLLLKTDDSMILSKNKFSKKSRHYDSAFSKIDINLSLLNLEEAQVVTNNWSPFKIVAIPFKDNPKKYYTFYSNHKLSEAFIVEGDMDNVTIHDTKGNSLGQTRRINGKHTLIDNGFVNIIKETAKPIDSPNLKLSSDCDCHGENSCENHQYDRMQNCGVYDFDQCMTCAEDVCDQDTKCRYGRTWTGPLYVISVAAHCIL